MYRLTSWARPTASGFYYIGVSGNLATWIGPLRHIEGKLVGASRISGVSSQANHVFGFFLPSVWTFFFFCQCRTIVPTCATIVFFCMSNHSADLWKHFFLVFRASVEPLVPTCAAIFFVSSRGPNACLGLIGLWCVLRACASGVSLERIETSDYEWCFQRKFCLSHFSESVM